MLSLNDIVEQHKSMILEHYAENLDWIDYINLSNYFDKNFLDQESWNIEWGKLLYWADGYHNPKEHDINVMCINEIELCSDTVELIKPEEKDDLYINSSRYAYISEVSGLYLKFNDLKAIEGGWLQENKI